MTRSTSDASLRILIVTGVRLYREGLGRMLADTSDIEIVGVASPREAIGKLVVDLNPDVLLIDSESAVRTDVCAVVSQASQGARVVAFAISEENRDEIVACAQAGVCGFVPSEASVEVLVDVLRRSGIDHAHCSPRITAALIRGFARSADVPARAADLATLTQRERQILLCVDGGLSNKEIANQLGISVVTVKNHIHNLLGKLSLRRRGEAAALLRSHSGLSVRGTASGI